MGITIHYEGTLDDPGILQDMLTAVRHFCFKCKWKYVDVDERIIGKLDDDTPVDDTLRGVIIQPHPNSEGIWLAFNQRGELCFYHGEEEPGRYRIQEGGFTKTQFAPIENHVAVCELLRMVKDNYFPGLQVWDEGEYWETGDVNRLAQHLHTLNRLMDAIEKHFDDQGISYERGKPINTNDPEWTRDHGISAGKN